MGVGKTIQALAICEIYKRDWPVVIICPSALRYTWREEIMKWMSDWVRPCDVQLITFGREHLNMYAKFHIMSYEMSVKLCDQFLERGVNIIIIDEAHYLKSWNSQRSLYLVPVVSQMKRVILLSGTPILQRPSEIYNLLKMIRPDLMVDF
jgi:SWI/SNF-related matrix-associated actin-dependent regulator of chromatin subfamily A-like protein 1